MENTIYSIINKRTGKAEEVLQLVDMGVYTTAQTATIGVRFEKKPDENGDLDLVNDCFDLVEGLPVDREDVVTLEVAKLSPEAIEDVVPVEIDTEVVSDIIVAPEVTGEVAETTETISEQAE